MNATQTYPDTYLHVYECRSGQTWIVPITDNEPLDLRAHLDKWIAAEYGGELVLNPPLMPRLDGDYYGKIMTDNRPPDSAVCWAGAGFYLKAPELSDAQLDASKEAIAQPARAAATPESDGAK